MVVPKPVKQEHQAVAPRPAVVLFSLQTGDTAFPTGSVTEGKYLQSTQSVVPPKIIRDAWRWKDAVLGDGRDYFVPRPRTLDALQTFLLQHANDWSFNGYTASVNECCVISNCARFEVIFSVERDDKSTPRIEEFLRDYLCAALLLQIRNWEASGPEPWWEQLLGEKMDDPGRVFHGDCLPDSAQMKCDAKALACYFTTITSDSVCRHLCTVAAGLACRPRRPDRSESPIFRPFSSRDAHILLQLKRTTPSAAVHRSNITLEGDTGLTSLAETVAATECIRLLRAALTAGKRARNPQYLPILNELRAFGTGNTKYDRSPPEHLLLRVIDIVRKEAIERVVTEYVTISQVPTSHIRHLRETVLSWSQTEEERKWLLQELHEPTLLLRQGNPLVVDDYLESIKEKFLKRTRADHECDGTSRTSPFKV